MSVQLLIGIIIALLGIQLWLRFKAKQQRGERQRGRFSSSERRKKHTLESLVNKEDE